MKTFATLLFAGLALGAIYALVALGLSVIFRASRIINFAQGELLALGALVTAALTSSGDVPFWAAFLIGAALTAAVGLAFQLLVLRFAVGKPDFTVVMLTLGLAAVVAAALDAAFGAVPRSNGDVWGSSVVHVFGLSLLWVQVWTIVSAIVLLIAFRLFNRFTPYGLSMRCAAVDPEAALAVGIPLKRVHALAWTLAGLVACVGGVFLGGYPNSVTPSISDIALLSFPAIILGGLDSTSGAVVGGFIIGVVELLTQGYQPTYAAFLGSDFYEIAPFVVMILALLVRPYGLFGSAPAERL